MPGTPKRITAPPSRGLTGERHPPASPGTGAWLRALIVEPRTSPSKGVRGSRGRSHWVIEPTRVPAFASSLFPESRSETGPAQHEMANGLGAARGDAGDDARRKLRVVSQGIVRPRG